MEVIKRGNVPYIAPVVVFPKTGEMKVRCGKCAGYEFTVHLKPDEKMRHYGRVTEIVCVKCKKWLPLDDQGMLQGRGKITKEKDNGCYSTKI